MVFQRVDGRLRGGQHLDVEALEQCPRAKLGARELLADVVVVKVRRLRVESYVDSENIGEHIAEPKRRWRAAKQMEIACEEPPGRARIGARRTTPRRHTQCF